MHFDFSLLFRYFCVSKFKANEIIKGVPDFFKGGFELPHAFRFANMKTTGCGAAWLARMVWDHEVDGSNPSTPTIPQNS